MDSSGDQQQSLVLNRKGSEEDEQLFMEALHLTKSWILPMVLKTAVELDLLEIIAKSKNNEPLSASDIASRLPARNLHTPVFVERILLFLVSNSILKCSSVTDEDGKSLRLYSAAPVCKYLTKNEDGASLAPYLVFLQDNGGLNSWNYLKDAVLEGDTPFNKAYGTHAYTYTDQANATFNEVMKSCSSLIMKRVLEEYNGFEDLNEVVDVGGGLGTTLSMIVSKYPHIKGINFDLPLVVKDAPIIPGVHHVGGDMFTQVPNGECILLKWILHNWDDDQCLKILKNCYDGLPNRGKVIVVEQLMPESPETDIISKNVFEYDILMLLWLPGAKERTKKEFEVLATRVGFGEVKFVCRPFGLWVIELYKCSN